MVRQWTPASFESRHVIPSGDLHRGAIPSLDFETPALVTTPDTNYFADTEATSSWGLITSGNYQNTWGSENTRETIRESGTGNKVKFAYELRRIPSGSAQTLYVEGFSVPGESEQGDFEIRYKWNTNGAACSATSSAPPCDSCRRAA